MGLRIKQHKLRSLQSQHRLRIVHRVPLASLRRMIRPPALPSQRRNKRLARFCLEVSVWKFLSGSFCLEVSHESFRQEKLWMPSTTRRAYQLHEHMIRRMTSSPSASFSSGAAKLIRKCVSCELKTPPGTTINRSATARSANCAPVIPSLFGISMKA